MSITARLAYSQLKVNRGRTCWALTAIALSTALTTAVCSFVASGNALLVSALGQNYGDYGAAYKGLLLAPAVVLALIIAAMSIVVIANVFRISAGERAAQFGILKCVGATGQQITSSVLWESILLSSVGIPLGILLGLALTLAGIQVANGYLGDLNDLTHLMLQKLTLTLSFVLSWRALAASAVFSFVTVLLSAWLPAHKAARVSAVDSIRGTGEIALPTAKQQRARPRTDWLVQRCFGFEGTLAVRNLRRNRRNFRATVTALSVGIMLFIALSALCGEANALQQIMLPAMPETVLAEYTSNWAEADPAQTGAPYAKPLDSREGEAVTQKLAEYGGGLTIWGMGLDLDSYHTALPAECLTPELRQALAAQEKPLADLDVEIITVDAANYAALCEKAGVPVGSVLLLNHYSWNDHGTEKHLKPFTEALQTVTLQKANGESTVMEIKGVLTQEQMPAELFYFNTNPVRLVVPQAMVRGYSWYAAPANEADFIEYANTVMAGFFPAGQSGDYMQAGFNTRVYKLTDYVKVMNIAIMLVSVFLYSFVALLMLIGLTNVISTMSTNVLMRAHEFAVLQSVGMTPEGLRRMLSLESVLCAGKALGIGLPLGGLVTWLVSIPVAALYPIPFRFPLGAMLACAAGVFAVTWVVTLCAAHRLHRQNIMDTIRAESGR